MISIETVYKWVNSGFLNRVEDGQDKINLAGIFEELKECIFTKKILNIPISILKEVSPNELWIFDFIVKRYLEDKTKFYLNGHCRLIIEAWKNQN